MTKEWSKILIMLLKIWCIEIKGFHTKDIFCIIKVHHNNLYYQKGNVYFWTNLTKSTTIHIKFMSICYFTFDYYFKSAIYLYILNFVLNNIIWIMHVFVYFNYCFNNVNFIRLLTYFIIRLIFVIMCIKKKMMMAYVNLFLLLSVYI